MLTLDIRAAQSWSTKPRPNKSGRASRTCSRPTTVPSTEIVLVDLPIDCLEKTVHKAAKTLSNPTLLHIESPPGQWSDQPYSQELLATLDRLSQLRLLGGFGPEDSLQIYFEPYRSNSLFTIEIIFSNITSFPPQRREQWFDTLRDYLNFAETLRCGDSEKPIYVAPESSYPPHKVAASDYATAVDW